MRKFPHETNLQINAEELSFVFCVYDYCICCIILYFTVRREITVYCLNWLNCSNTQGWCRQQWLSLLPCDYCNIHVYAIYCIYSPMYCFMYNIYSTQLTLKVLNFWKFTSYCSFKTLMVGHGGSSAGSYLANPTSPIPSHCASIVVTSKEYSQTDLWDHSRNWKFVSLRSGGLLVQVNSSDKWFFLTNS